LVRVIQDVGWRVRQWSSKSKVKDLACPIHVKADIGWFEIAVDNSSLMKIFKRRSNLRCNLKALDQETLLFQSLSVNKSSKERAVQSLRLRFPSLDAIIQRLTKLIQNQKVLEA
jgi:hypothetical protein